jgi:hypothetical protein
MLVLVSLRLLALFVVALGLSSSAGNSWKDLRKREI